MRFLTADLIYTISSPPLKEAVVVVGDNGTIETVLEIASEIDPLKIEPFRGIICPGFINTHCHLELSHLKNKITAHTGIVAFALELMQKRFSFSPEEIAEAAADANAELFSNGVVAVGDISNNNSSFGVKAQSSIYYHTFVELISLNPDRAEAAAEAGKILLSELEQLNLKGSLAPHAPYSVSGKLIRLIGEAGNSPTSIHNQESRAEDEFIRSKKGDYLNLYEQLNIPIGYFSPTGESSLRTVLPHFAPQHNTLLVHNTFTPTEDLIYALQQHAHLFWCLCPNANLYIENSLPDVYNFRKYNCNITIGTDSLASNYSLSVLNELKTLATHFPLLSTDELLRWATWNGAVFLGLEKTYGSIEPGKKCGLNLVTEMNNGQLTSASEVIRLC